MNPTKNCYYLKPITWHERVFFIQTRKGSTQVNNSLSSLDSEGRTMRQEIIKSFPEDVPGKIRERVFSYYCTLPKTNNFNKLFTLFLFFFPPLFIFGRLLAFPFLFSLTPPDLNGNPCIFPIIFPDFWLVEGIARSKSHDTTSTLLIQLIFQLNFGLTSTVKILFGFECGLHCLSVSVKWAGKYESGRALVFYKRGCNSVCVSTKSARGCGDLNGDFSCE